MSQLNSPADPSNEQERRAARAAAAEGMTSEIRQEIHIADEKSALAELERRANRPPDPRSGAEAMAASASAPLRDAAKAELERRGRPVPYLEPGRKFTAAKPALTLATRDSNGYVPDRTLLGKVFCHTNGKHYRVTGFAWDSESDQWKLALKADDEPVTCLRGLHNFEATNEAGERRYTPVEG